MAIETLDDKVGEEAVKIYLEGEDSLTDHINALLTEIIKAYIAYHLCQNLKWLPKIINHETPKHICEFITQKCGSKEKGFEGQKILCASYGLPTHSRQVSEFMMGLEKTKVRAGKISSLAWALSLQDMHPLYDQCFQPSATAMEMRQGIVRYVKVIHVDFKSINIIPGECEFELNCLSFDVHLKTWKSAQTGITHAWTLHANDDDPKIWTMWALIQLAVLYGENITLSGPLFLKVNKNGAIMQDTPVTSCMLSRGLTTDLQDLGYKSWALYGTHSFH
ncbi:hypothetical protein L208DRAFT_1425813 [Tricholoma matsutake]|nr:hypothetical protein L208DRAFT_1425813 [Tricholoma matsutake 945]